MSKIRVAIIRGGLSEEYTVSLWTGAVVLENIDREMFEPLDIIITKNGEWLHNGKAWLPEHILQSVDVVFNALHGKYGEDGTIQRLMDRYGVPYTGSKAFASSVAMNKILTKNFLKKCEIEPNIKMAPHIHVSKASFNNTTGIAEKIVDMFGPQYVIKPVSSGSSTGTMMVKNPAMLAQALKDALTVYDDVMVEARIFGQETTCGVIEHFRGDDLYALPPIEIVPSAETGFFDAICKRNGFAGKICPARFDNDTKNEIIRLAKTVHQTLNLSQYSRSDFIIADDGIYFLEVNTLPGLTKESLFPKALDVVGSSYKDFITHVLIDTLSSRLKRV
jgi:D-alanine-D-alanine ligase